MNNSIARRRSRIAISLCVSSIALAGAALADTPIAPESFDDYQNALRAIRQQAAEISGYGSTSCGVEIYTNRLNVLLANQRELEAIIDKAGGDITAMKAEISELDSQWSSGAEDLNSTVKGNVATSAATRALSIGAKRLAGVLGWVETGVEYGYRFVVKEQTESQLEDYVEQQQSSLAELEEVWSFQQAAINEMVGDLKQLEALDQKYDQTLAEMGERYPAQSANPGGRASDFANLDRVTDPAGDAAECKEAVRTGIQRTDGQPPVWNGGGRSKIKITPASQGGQSTPGGAGGGVSQNHGGSGGGNSGGANAYSLQPGVRIFVGAQYTDVQHDLLGVGVVLDQTGERFASTTGSKLSQFGAGGGVQYYTPTLGGFTLTAGQVSDSGTVTGAIAPGTDVTGNVNLDFNPNNGSTGILYGAAGLDTQINYDYGFLQIGGAWTPPEHMQGLPGGIGWSPTLEWTRFRQDYSTFAAPPAFNGDIVDLRDIEVRNFYLDFSVEFWREFELAAYGPLGSILMRPYVSVGGTHFKQTLDAMQDFTCNICGPDDNFQLAISDKEDGFTWNADFGTWLEIGVGGGVSLYGDVRYELIGSTTMLFIPRTGDDLFLDNRPAGIEDSDDTFERFTASVGMKFSF